MKVLENKWFRVGLFVVLIGLLCFWQLSNRLFTFLGEGLLTYGADALFHLNRLQSIADGLAHGQFPVLLYPNAAYGFGYASPLFYPDLFFYPFALLVLCGMQVEVAFCIMEMTMIFFSAFTMFLFVRHVGFEYFYALATSALLISMQYVLINTLARSAIGELSAFIFWPLLFWGLYDMAIEGFQKPWLLLIAELGLAFSHTISLAISVLIILVITLAFCPKLFTDRKWWIKVGFLLLFFLLIGGVYFFPMAEQLLKGQYIVSTPWTYAYLAALSLPEIFGFLVRKPGSEQGMVDGYGNGVYAFWLLVVAVGLRVLLLLTKKGRKKLWPYDLMLLAIVLDIFAISEYFPWKKLHEILPLSDNIQFPWRLNVFLCFAIPMYLVAMLREVQIVLCDLASFIHVERVVKIVKIVCSNVVFGALIVVFACTMMGANLSNRFYRDTYQPYYVYFYVAPEWLPAQGNQFTTPGVMTYEDDLVPVEYERESGTFTFLFEGKAEHTYILPVFYYQGYEVLMTHEDGTKEKFTYEPSRTGSGIQFTTGEKSGSIKVSYVGTPVQKISYAFAVLGTVSCVTFYYLMEKKKK